MLARATAGDDQEQIGIIGSHRARIQEIEDRDHATAVVQQPAVATVALPLDRVSRFFERIRPALAALDPSAEDISVAHLGDGNIHYTVYPSRNDPALADAIMEAVEDVVRALGGSFSAEHGIGLSKKRSMARRKDPVALRVMGQVKAALDPKGIMNPGKVLPD